MGSDLASLADSSRMEIPAADATLPAVSEKDTSSPGPVNGGIQRQSPVWKPIVMQAKHQTPCSYCHLPISPGNAIYPWVRFLDVNQSLKAALNTVLYTLSGRLYRLHAFELRIERG